MKNSIKNMLLAAGCTLVLASCLENDIPYPIVEGSIQSFEVEGQRAATEGGNAQATINKTNRTISLYVDDSVDLSRLRVTRLTVSNDAEIVPDSTACADFHSFPTTGFESIPSSANTRIDFTRPVQFTVKTYQDYVWTVTVQQILDRELVLANQTKDPVIDVESRKVIIYVSKDQPLNSIPVITFNLGGAHGTVTPDPTKTTTFDFSSPVTFYVRRGWEEVSYDWTVYVFHDTDSSTDTQASVFPMATRATLSGSIQSGKTPVVEYRKQGASSWTTLSSSSVSVKGTSYTATLTGLSAGTTYQYRVSVDGNAAAEQSFSTAPALALENGSFDDWHQVDKLWNPWAEGGTSYWDTGNRGATTVGNSNSIPTTETSSGSGQAACLESKWIVLKFAAGNIFTGTYVKTDGTNGVLSFGREFNSFPSKLRVHYKYTTATINRCGDDEFEYLKGRPDSCHIYIALTDWDQPREIRTRPSERQLFDKSDSHVIAYAELIKGESNSTYKEEDLVLNYRYTNRTPKYILVVASASKYGDYFTGGEGSKLWIDDFELIYD
ncbi:MAG: PCMD domain-containing protein [Bacteroidales bacterium]|nr:PCMD domain-containing protein [Bacteroidales bacterium]